MNLKDYLHLYLGCEIMYHRINKTDVLTKEKLLDLDGLEHLAKPLLRPLSDMTEEEAVALVFAAEGAKADFVQWYTDSGEIGGFEWISDHYRKGQRHNTWYESFEPEGTRYLLSRCFDLFGLIPAGLAIDKTTLNKAV